MASLCFYFQVHQPYRLRRYSVFDTDAFYFDDDTNAAICRRVAKRSYVPATRLLLELIRRHGDRFRCAFSITGMAIEQFERFAPDVLDGFGELAQTGQVEFLGETYHHSLASLFSPREFAEQVERHARLMADRFGKRPTTFRNTELIYSDAIARQAAALGFTTVLAEGDDATLAGREPRCVFLAEGGLRLLLRNYRLSDDIAFRFANRGWDQWPLTAERFGSWVDVGEPCRNVFIDLEAIGEHLDADTGIFSFVEKLPEEMLRRGHRFVTPGEIAHEDASPPPLSIVKPTSWADSERDVSAWLGNAMQENAAAELYKLEPAVRAASDAQLLEDWRRLQASDHFYYMSTKYFSDGAVHKYFSPYESPYDSYINFMNVLDNIKSRAGV